MSIVIAERPGTIGGSMQTWSEQSTTGVIRSSMEGLDVKVRRRTTAVVTQITCTLVLPRSKYQDFMDWFYVAQKAGAIPTRIRRPYDRAELVVRAMEMPSISWTTAAEAFTANMKFEHLPIWDGL